MCWKKLIPLRAHSALRTFKEVQMGFQKGSIALSDGRDKPLLLQVLHSQFITHDQLFEFMQLGAYEFSRAVFNWRTRRLVSCGFLLRHLVPPVTREPVYTIENTA